MIIDEIELYALENILESDSVEAFEDILVWSYGIGDKSRILNWFRQLRLV